MLADVEFPWDVRPIVLSHHERWDGKGYPHGLAGEDIPLTARILGVADVYDALTSVRSYKRALTHDEAVALLRKDVGTMFDPRVFAWFEEVAPAWAARTAAEQAQGARTPARGAPRQPAPGHDALTGLPGRALLAEEVDRVLASRGAAEPLSVVVVRVADGASDAELVRVGEALCRNTSGGSAVGRLERVEFAVALPDVPLTEARVLAERLRVAAAEAVARQGAAARDVWVGVAVAGPGASSAAALFAAAGREGTASPEAAPAERAA
jgi:GGDEF domain-containing protein